MVTALFAGSFDPITYGHIDIIKSSAEIFDKVIVAVAYNCNKNGLIPIEKRVELIKECTTHLSNIEVTSYTGLTADYAKECNATVLIRGLRNATDFEYEKELSQINTKLNTNIKTIFLLAKPEYSCISSSSVREILIHKGDISGFVPTNVEKYLINDI